MIRGTSIKLHVELSLHFFVLLLPDFRCVIFLFILTKQRLVGLAKEPVNLISHLLSEILALHLLLAVDQILEIHIFVAWELSVCTLALRPVARESLPIKVLPPSLKLESELESHVSWQGHAILVEVVGGENAPDMSIGANGDRSNLVATFDQVGWRQDARLFQNVVEIDHNNGPAIVFELKRYLSNKAVGCSEILEKIAQRNSNTVRPLGHTKVQMIAEWKTMAGTLDLEIHISASQTKLLDGSLGVWHLNKVIG